MNRAFITLLMLLLAACNRGGKASDGNDRLSVDRLYPLPQGAVWSYDVDTGQGLPILAITRVTKVEGTHIEVTSGSEPVTYEQRPEGLYRPDRNAFVLHAPVRVGATWDAGGGATAKVQRIDASAETAAGKYQGCVEIVETGSASGKVVRSVFCPDVGPVEVESSLPAGPSGDTVRVIAKLRGIDLSGKLAPK